VDLLTDPRHGSLMNDPVLGLRDQIEVARADVTDLTQIQPIISSAGCFDLIYHFAAYGTVVEKSAHNPYDTIQSNTMGLVNILEAVRRTKARPAAILFASTDKVYGEMNGDAYEEDKTPLRGIGVYDSAKLAADVFTRTYFEAFNLPTIILRMCNLFGPYDYNYDYRLVPKSLKSIYANDPPKPPELYYDSLDHWRDYLYIDDAVQAILLLTYYPTCRGEVFNLLASRFLSTPEMLRTLVLAVAELEREHNWKRADDILRNGISLGVRDLASNIIMIKKQHLNGGKLKRMTGFEPTTDFQRGLMQTIRYYRDFFQANQIQRAAA